MTRSYHPWEESSWWKEQQQGPEVNHECQKEQSGYSRVSSEWQVMMSKEQVRDIFYRAV